MKNMLIALLDNEGQAHIGWVEDWAGLLVVCDNEGCPIMHALEPWFIFWMPLPKPPKK
jgi:hypothetical protein